MKNKPIRGLFMVLYVDEYGNVCVNDGGWEFDHEPTPEEVRNAYVDDMGSTPEDDETRLVVYRVVSEYMPPTSKGELIPVSS